MSKRMLQTGGYPNPETKRQHDIYVDPRSHWCFFVSHSVRSASTRSRLVSPLIVMGVPSVASVVEVPHRCRAQTAANPLVVFVPPRCDSSPNCSCVSVLAIDEEGNALASSLVARSPNRSCPPNSREALNRAGSPDRSRPPYCSATPDCRT